MQAAAHPCDASCAHRGTAARLFRAGALLAVFPAAWALSGWLQRDSAPFLCPFRCVTGQPCPFCGLTRAIAMGTHLQWRQAFHLNALWPLAMAMIVLLAIFHVVDAFTARQLVKASIGYAVSRWVWILSALLMFDAVRIAFTAI